MTIFDLSSYRLEVLEKALNIIERQDEKRAYGGYQTEEIKANLNDSEGSAVTHMTEYFTWEEVGEAYKIVQKRG